MSLETLKQTPDKTIGVKETLRAVEEDKAEIVFIAEDADDSIIEPLKTKCEEKQIDMRYVSSMQELGKAAGIEVKATSACILK